MSIDLNQDLFDKWEFVRLCEEQISIELKNGNISDEEECWDMVFEMISSATIYTYDCFRIIQQLNFIHFEGATFPINNIYDAAYNALYEWSLEKVDVDNLVRNV